MESAITSKGQATIPKAVRDYLHLTSGDKVKFFFHPDGSVVLLPKLPITVLRGVVPPRPEGPPSIEEMDEAIAREATVRYERSSRE